MAAGLVSAQFKAVVYPLHQALGIWRRKHPLFKICFPQTLLAGADKDDNAALPHRVFGVFQRFLRLIKVDVFGEPARGNEHNFRGARDSFKV